jgi:hypothetical protein
VAAGPADLLAVVPYRLGFHPADSVLLLELLAPDARTGRQTLGLVVRGDLPPAAEGDALRVAAEAAAQACLRLVRRAARPTSEVLVVLYDPDARVTSDGLLPGARAAATLEAVRSGLEPPPGGVGPRAGDHLLVGGGRWRTLSCAGPCCPRQGEPWSPDGTAGSGGASRLPAEAVWRGFTAAPDRAASLPQLTPADPARCARAAVARREPVPPAQARALVLAFDRAVDRQVGGGGATEFDAAWCGRLLRALDRLEVRDALLLSGSRGPSTPRGRKHLLRPPGAAPSAVGAVHLRRALDDEADPVRAAAAADLAVQVARCGATSGGGAEAWAAAAWLEWTAGRPARMAACVEEALRQDPGHRLAGVLAVAVRDGVGPSRPGRAARAG